MQLATVLFSGVIGLAFVGWGVVVATRGAPPVLKSTGRTWRTTGAASTFFLLLGGAILIGDALRVGARAGVVGPDGGFWISLVPIPLILLAVTLFRPRTPTPEADD